MGMVGLLGLALVGFYFQEQRRAGLYFTQMVGVSGVDFATHLQHETFSLDSVWSGELSGPQQAQLLKKHWRSEVTDEKNPLPPTREESPGTYFNGADATFPYTLRISGLPAGLDPEKLEQVAQGPGRQITILLHSVGGI